VVDIHDFKQIIEIAASLKPLSIPLVDQKVHEMRKVRVIGFIEEASAQFSIRLSRSDNYYQNWELSCTSWFASFIDDLLAC